MLIRYKPEKQINLQNPKRMLIVTFSINEHSSGKVYGVPKETQL